MKKYGQLILLGILLLMVFAACAGENTVRNVPDSSGSIAGVFDGLIHGLIAPYSFIMSVFFDNVTVYEVHNSGFLYDLGFVIGAGVLFGGSKGVISRSKN